LPQELLAPLEALQRRPVLFHPLAPETRAFQRRGGAWKLHVSLKKALERVDRLREHPLAQGLANRVEELVRRLCRAGVIPCHLTDLSPPPWTARVTRKLSRKEKLSPVAPHEKYRMARGCSSMDVLPPTRRK